MNSRKRWLVVAVYSMAMAWLESAVVYYLRTWSDRIDPHQFEPLPKIAGLGPVELVREAATLLMLFTVGLLAGGNWRSRWGYAAVAFGVWDIAYYVFLRVSPRQRARRKKSLRVCGSRWGCIACLSCFSRWRC